MLSVQTHDLISTPNFRVGLVAAFKDAGKTSRRLNAIVRNKYADNPQKLAAWEIASHLEAAPKRENNNPPNPNTPPV